MDFPDKQTSIFHQFVAAIWLYFSYLSLYAHFSRFNQQLFDCSDSLTCEKWHKQQMHSSTRRQSEWENEKQHIFIICPNKYKLQQRRIQFCNGIFVIFYWIICCSNNQIKIISFSNLRSFYSINIFSCVFVSWAWVNVWLSAFLCPLNWCAVYLHLNYHSHANGLVG